MQTHVSTTPFGRRPMSLGQLASQMSARDIPETAVVHKWQVFKNIRIAKDALGATDRGLAILNALLTFHPETALSGDGALVVWPSNEQLIARSNGMSPATLRRHLANLVDCGLIIRRDSPNGKRYARKGKGGEIERAFGFDLSPIVARVQEIEDLAAAVDAERRALKRVREDLTLCRRDIVKLIETGLEEGIPGDWGSLQTRYQAAVAKLPRTAPRQALELVAKDLDGLRRDVRQTLESFINSQNLSDNESQTARHIQNSNPEPSNEIEEGNREGSEASGTAERNDNVRSLPKRELPLGIVLDACPEIVALDRKGEIRSWRDLIAAADLARTMLGVSPSAWAEAKAALGEDQAAITIAAIYQRSDQIKSAGGYLRSLTERAKDGKFSPWPMIMALLRAKLTERAKAS